MKKYFAPLVIKEMHIKTTMRYHLIPTRMTIILKQKNQKITSIGEDVEKLESLNFAGGTIN